MLKRAQSIRATGLETFIDVLDLRPGDEWKAKIFAAIDESDLFRGHMVEERSRF